MFRYILTGYDVVYKWQLINYDNIHKKGKTYIMILKGMCGESL